MRIKDSTVNTRNLCNEIASRLPELDARIYSYTKKELTITSGNDGEHKKGSFHYKDRAIDIRVVDWYCSISNLIFLLEGIKEIFPPLMFDIIFEGDHLHIEYDPA